MPSSELQEEKVLGIPIPNNATVSDTNIKDICNNSCEILNRLFNLNSAAIVLLASEQTHLLSTLKPATNAEHAAALLSSWKSKQDSLINTSSNFKALNVSVSGFERDAAWIKLLSLHSESSIYILIPDATAIAGVENEKMLAFVAESLSGKLWSAQYTFGSANAFLLQSLMLDNNTDLVFIKDSEFRIVYANQAFVNAYPESARQKIIGYTTFEDYEQSDIDIFLAQDKLAFEKGISEIEESIVMPNGQRKTLLTTKQRFIDLDGHEYILGTAKDITDLRNTINQLVKLNEELDEFVSIASHDLKAPLNAIEKLLKWIEEDCGDILPEDAKENMGSVFQRVDRMKRLLRDLLHFSKSGRETERHTELTLENVIEELVDMSFPDAKLDVSLDSGVIYVQPTMFKTVFTNLLSNAMKHNDKEVCKISISMVTSPHYYRFCFTDNGPGIEEQYHERVFKLFHTLKPRDKVEASGVGLSVIKKIMDQIKGQVKIISDGKLGTSFEIKWPKA